MRTKFPQVIEVSGVTDTVLTQETAESESAKVKFPKRIKSRDRVLAAISSFTIGVMLAHESAS
jgi:hypothetical protein